MLQRNYVRLLLSSCALLLVPDIDGQRGCSINGSSYSYCQVVGWTAWTSCSSPCIGGSPVRNIIVCCPPSFGSHINVTKDTCFSYCNVLITVITKETGKIECLHQYIVEKILRGPLLEWHFLFMLNVYWIQFTRHESSTSYILFSRFNLKLDFRSLTFRKKILSIFIHIHPHSLQ